MDPITFEVIRHKLQSITEEQAITLKSISGSPVVTDATDFNNGLYLGDGSIVTMGAAGDLPHRHDVNRDPKHHCQLFAESGDS